MDEIFALVVSCLIEGPTSYVTGRVTKWPCREGAENAPKRMAWSSVFATGITHPHAWNLYHNMRPVYGFWLSFLVVETLVTLAEGILICWMAGLPMKQIQKQCLCGHRCHPDCQLLILSLLHLWLQSIWKEKG